MLNSFVSRKTFMVHSQNGKKSISKDIFYSLSMKVDNNNKHRCQQCRQKPEHFPKVRITYRYTHSYKVPAQHLLLLQVVATKTLKIQVPYINIIKYHTNPFLNVQIFTYVLVSNRKELSFWGYSQLKIPVILVVKSKGH